MNKRINSHILLFLILTLSSCQFRPFFIKNVKKEERKEKRTEKRATRRGNTVTVPNDSSLLVKIPSTAPSVPDMSWASGLLKTKKLNYNTFQCQTKIHIETTDEKQNLSAVIRMKRNEVIWVSILVPIIGEAARAYITPDSVKAYEKINKRKYLYHINDLKKIINMDADFFKLQELIIGNAIADEGELTEVKELNALTTIYVKGADYSNQLGYSKNDSLLRQMLIQTNRPVSSSSLLITLNNYQPAGSGWFSTLRNIFVQDVKGAVNMYLEIKKFDIDQEIETPFKIPAGYKLHQP